MADFDSDEYDEEYGYDRSADGDADEEWSGDHVDSHMFEDYQGDDLDEMSAEDLIASYEAQESQLAVTGKTKISRSMDVANNIRAEKSAGEIESHQVGMASTQSLKEGQLAHHDIKVQHAFVQAREGRLDGSRAGVDDVKIAAALLRMEKDTGVKAEDVRVNLRKEQVGGKVKKVDPSVYAGYSIGEAQEVPYISKFIAKPSKQTVNLLLGYATKSEDYLQRGAGSAMVGNIMGRSSEGTNQKTLERRDEEAAERDMALEEARGLVSRIADMYIPEATKERGGKLYAQRKHRIEEAIYGRFMDSTAYDGGEAALALPNELGVFKEGDAPILGLVPTASLSGNRMTSPYTRLQWANVKHEFEKGSKEHLRHQPSLKNSLMPVDWKNEFQADPKKYRDDQWKEFMGEVTAARRTIRKETISVADESYGNQMRTTGWHKPYGEQAATHDAWQEGNIFGLSLEKEDVSGKGKSVARGRDPLDMEARLVTAKKGIAEGVGSYHGDMYGEKGDSEMTLYAQAREAGLSEEQALEVATTSADIEDILEEPTEADLFIGPASPFAPAGSTDREKYLYGLSRQTLHKQGGDEWLAQRKGKVTASVSGLLTKAQGDRKMASLLGAEKFMGKEKFRGNAHTVDGNKGEGKALAAFLAMEGNDLEAEEAYFESYEGNERIGASPDARLFNPDGSSAGLLELKYLSPKSLPEARNKYLNQMQMQMLVAGERQTHFFALDKHTGDYVHEVVKADPMIQQELLDGATSALELFDAMNDVEDLDDMRNKIESKAPPRRKSGSSSGRVASKKEAAFVGPPKPDPMAAFRPGAQESPYADKLAPQQKRIANEAAKQQVSAEGGDFLETLKMFEDQMLENTDAAEREAMARDDQRAAMAQAEEAEKKKTSETERASKILGFFANAVQDAADAVLAGNQSGMDDVRFAAKTGIEAGQLRGMRKVMESGGMSTKGIDATFRSLGDLQKTFNNEQTGAAEFTRMLKERGVSNLEGVKGLEIPTFDELRGLDAQGFAGRIAGMMEGQNAEVRAQIGHIFDVEDMAGFKGSSEELAKAFAQHFEDRKQGFYDTRGGAAKAEQQVRYAEEFAGSRTNNLGANAGWSAVMQTKASSYKSANAFSKTLTAAGLSGYTLGGGMADAMDPGEAGREDWNQMFLAPTRIKAFFGNDDAEKKLAQFNNEDWSIPGSAAEARKMLNSNVEVNVTVDPDSVRTEVDDNGEKYLDTENTYGTGGGF